MALLLVVVTGRRTDAVCARQKQGEIISGNVIAMAKGHTKSHIDVITKLEEA